MKASEAARRMEPGKRYVLRRKTDGQYLEVWGWSTGWTKDPSFACPFFTSENLGPFRRDDVHKRMLETRTSARAKELGEYCELVQFDDPSKGLNPKPKKT